MQAYHTKTNNVFVTFNNINSGNSEELPLTILFLIFFSHIFV
nr:MAG TPA: hypothetical protein [Caudoviricetes sp.]